MNKNYDYWRYPEEGYPKNIYWKKIIGLGRLSILQEYDIVFDEQDLRIRKLTLKDLI